MNEQASVEKKRVEQRKIFVVEVELAEGKTEQTAHLVLCCLGEMMGLLSPYAIYFPEEKAGMDGEDAMRVDEGFACPHTCSTDQHHIECSSPRKYARMPSRVLRCPGMLFAHIAFIPTCIVVESRHLLLLCWIKARKRSVFFPWAWRDSVSHLREADTACDPS
jgi:hypothetical protein